MRLRPEHNLQGRCTTDARILSTISRHEPPNRVVAEVAHGPNRSFDFDFDFDLDLDLDLD